MDEIVPSILHSLLQAAAHFGSSLVGGSPVGASLEPVTRISQTAATMVAGTLWQSALVAIALAVCARLIPRTTAAHRFGLWGAGFLAVASLSLLPWIMPMLPVLHWLGGSHGASAAYGESAAVRPWLQIPIGWSFAVAGLWLAASLVRAVDLAVHSVRLRRLWKTAVPIEMTGSQVAALELGQSRTVQICSTRELDRPSVIGFFAPRILIPEWLLERVSAAELDQIVLHEAEHLRRRDDWTNLFQKLCLVVFPLNPALLWMESRLCREREMACDEAVVERTHARRAYATCLANLAQHGLQHRLRGRAAGFAAGLSLGAWQRRPELARRVHSILRQRRALGPAAARGVFAVLGMGLIFGSVELAHSPQLVAFVAPAKADVGRRIAANADATEAVAGLPAVQNAVPSLVQNVDARGVSGSRVRPYETKVKAVVPEGGAVAASGFSPRRAAWDSEASDGTEQAGFVVLTAWEQVQVSDAGAGRMAVLETDQAPGEDAQAIPDELKIRPVSSPYTGGTMTVTRLIFRVVPARFSAAGSRNTPASMPIPVVPGHPGHPDHPDHRGHPVQPVRSDWFFLQL